MVHLCLSDSRLSAFIRGKLSLVFQLRKRVGAEPKRRLSILEPEQAHRQTFHAAGRLRAAA
jgi:hypothetical protein